MNEAPRGKIGRLPTALQEQLNRRLAIGEKGRPLVAWLNSLPEVQAVLAAEFAGKPIREQNLSDWRKYGYSTWLWRQQALDLAKELLLEIGHTQAAAASTMTDQIAGWATAQYLMAVRKLLEQSAGGGPDLKTLRAFLHDVVAVRRGDHSAARLKLKQERLERKEEKAQEAGLPKDPARLPLLRERLPHLTR